MSIEINKIYNIDCLDGMKQIDDRSVDMILCDLPYGITECKWDTIIPFDKLWAQYNRVIKDNGAICLFGSEPFSTQIRSSNLEHFKYDWIWEKNTTTGFQHSKNMPLRKHEVISVFSKAPIGHLSLLGDRRMVYNPQGVSCSNKIKKIKNDRPKVLGVRPNQIGKEFVPCNNFPTSILNFNTVNKTDIIHPTQKPVALLEWLIKTYTNEEELVLDNCIGSGSTAVACINTGRNYIGFEIDKGYFDSANERIEQHMLKIAQ